jgi:hypothetical protein
MITIKGELPSKATPAALFLAGFIGFGGVLVKLPPPDRLSSQIFYCIIGTFAVACGACFFTKVFWDWPHTRGLSLPPARRR